LINYCGDYVEGIFFKKWFVLILCNFVDIFEWMVELDVNEGVVLFIEMRFFELGIFFILVFLVFMNVWIFVIL